MGKGGARDQKCEESFCKGGARDQKQVSLFGKRSAPDQKCEQVTFGKRGAPDQKCEKQGTLAKAAHGIRSASRANLCGQQESFAFGLMPSDPGRSLPRRPRGECAGPGPAAEHPESRVCVCVRARRVSEWSEPHFGQRESRAMRNFSKASMRLRPE